MSDPTLSVLFPTPCTVSLCLCGRFDVTSPAGLCVSSDMGSALTRKRGCGVMMDANYDE